MDYPMNTSSDETNNCQQIAHLITDNLSKDVILDDDTSFEDLMLTPNTQKGLQRCGFKSPSPIQLKAIPYGRCGIDLVIQSKAGTGKTCIFTVIALEALKFNLDHSTQTLILAPTREIALQIHGVISQIGSTFQGLNCALCIGGVDLKQDRAKFAKKPCQIVVGTPGRINQLIEMGVLKLHDIELLILDEADKLMDDQFKIQIDQIFRVLPQEKQMIVTSATYPNELDKFLKKYMRVSRFVRVGNDISLEAIEEYFVECKAGNSSKKTLINKLSCLTQILNSIQFKKCIVFTNFQARAPQICDSLNRDDTFVQRHGRTNYLSAELSQEQRTLVFNKFKTSDQRLLVSTDISARGIDIAGIELVINLDLPYDNATYYHRIGRAGRFGRPGKAICIMSSESADKAVFMTSIWSKKIKKLTLDEGEQKLRLEDQISSG